MNNDTATKRESSSAIEDASAHASLQRPVIHALCPLYVCRICRTKTGWPHQIGCGMLLLAEPGCVDCRYWSVRKNECDHPARRKGGERR